MRFHPYKQPYLVELPKGTTIRDLQALADFNRIIRNYMQMVELLTDRDMTKEEMHEYNKRQAIHDLSYWSVCTTEFTIKLRYFMIEWLSKAYEAGFKAAKEGKL